MGRRGMGLELASYAVAAASFVFGFVHQRLHPPPYEPPPRTDELLRVVTWNVGAGMAAGGGGFDDAHLEHVARVLRGLDPDLCFLQELTGRIQARRIERELGRGWRMELSPPGSSRRIAAFARRGSLEAFDTSGAGRRSLGVEYRSPDHGRVMAVSIHADAFSAEERNATIGAATMALFERATPETPLLLLGDLNLDLDLDKRRDLFTDDAYLDVETYNFVAERLEDAARRSGPTAEPDRRLDYVFASPALEARDAGAWKGRRVGAMDHDPVVVDFAFR